MARDSWTRRLDDRVLGSTGLLVVLGVASAYFAVAGVSAVVDGVAVGAIVYGVLGLLSAQAVRTQWRSRKRVK